MRLRVGICILFLLCFAGSALAGDPIIYPKKGQGPQKIEKDKFECYTWAKNETGFDPLNPPGPTTPPPVKTKSKVGVLTGAAGGAVVGLATGSLMSEAAKGAAIGAASGALLGGVVKSKHQTKEERKQQQWEQDQAAILQEKRNGYNRAFGACMEARDYTVK
jgi:hypothetical protein